MPGLLRTRLLKKGFLGLLAMLLLAQGCATSSRLVREDIYAKNILFTVSSDAEYSVLASGFGGASPGSEAGINEVIESILESHDLLKVSRFPIRSMGVEAVVAEINTEQVLLEVIQALAEDERVQSAQSIRPYKLLGYNDPYYALQNTVNGDRIEHIHEFTTGKNVVVGIIDTGVDRWHPELAGNIIYSSNHVSGDQASFDLDEHGTAVAGVIGSAANNDLGIVGVAPDVRLMVFKACRQELASRRTSCDSVSIIKALNDVLLQQPDILNLSLSGRRDPMIEKLLKVASNKGMVLIAAVDETRPVSESFPANMPEVIAVGTALSSARAEDMVLAPGTDLLTTAPGATYGFKSGSSMATAYVSGIAALMKETVPGLSSDQIHHYLLESSRLDVNRFPVVDMCLAVNQAANTSYRNCDRARSMALRVEGPIGTMSNAELTN